MKCKKALFRFYEELNYFLPKDRRKISFYYPFEGKPSVKDAIEAIGVPHTEVDLIIINGESVSFDYHIKDNDIVSVYPLFESIDISPIAQIRQKPLRNPRFILDVHLGKLAKYMRMLGFDTLYENNYDDYEIIRIAKVDNRIILTKDIGILKNKVVTHGYCIKKHLPKEQLKEIVFRFNLELSFQPFRRCIKCNKLIEKVSKEFVIDKIEPKTKLYYNDFYQCASCRKIYWKGSHYWKMKKFINNFLKE